MSEQIWWGLTLAALLFCWLAGDVELAGWTALFWIGAAGWRLYHAPTAQERFEMSGQYVQGSITDTQIQRIVSLCHRHHLEVPENLSGMSAAEARLFISEQTGEEERIDY